MSIHMADSCCLQQKLTQHCKAIILQLKQKNSIKTSIGVGALGLGRKRQKAKSVVKGKSVTWPFHAS